MRFSGSFWKLVQATPEWKTPVALGGWTLGLGWCFGVARHCFSRMDSFLHTLLMSSPGFGVRHTATPTCLPGTGGPLQSCNHCSTGAIWNQAILREECGLGCLAAAQPNYAMEEVLMLNPAWEILGSPCTVLRIRSSLWLLPDDNICRVL